jgi:hypothetical protein
MATRTFAFFSDKVSVLASTAEPPEKAGFPARTRVMSSAHAQAYKIFEKRERNQAPNGKIGIWLEGNLDTTFLRVEATVEVD